MSSAAKIKMITFDELFGVQENSEQVMMVPLVDLYPFRNHPFKVADDDKMRETVESIREHGVLVPAIARPRSGGGYELISGHRRKRGSELAGKSEMPVVVRNYSDDEATIIMVDANIQREDLLPSEKAKAYKMKYEALKHQGKKAEMNALDKVGEIVGENAKKVQRYIRLASLSDELLLMVDCKKIGFSQGLDLSFLSCEEQEWVRFVLCQNECNISLHQSGLLKELAKKGELTLAEIRVILDSKKTKGRKVTLRNEHITKFFGDNYTDNEIEEIILRLLEKWAKREGEEA